MQGLEISFDNPKSYPTEDGWQHGKVQTRQMIILVIWRKPIPSCLRAHKPMHQFSHFTPMSCKLIQYLHRSISPYNYKAGSKLQSDFSIKITVRSREGGLNQLLFAFLVVVSTYGSSTVSWSDQQTWVTISEQLRSICWLKCWTYIKEMFVGNIT